MARKKNIHSISKTGSTISENAPDESKTLWPKSPPYWPSKEDLAAYSNTGALWFTPDMATHPAPGFELEPKKNKWHHGGGPHDGPETRSTQNLPPFTVSSTTLIPVGSPESSQDPYEPFEHRQVEHPTTDFETWIHMLKGSLGTGILAMPNAFLNAGLIVGAIFTVVIGVTCTYCLHVLIRAQYFLCTRAKVPVLNYRDTMRMALEMGPRWLRPTAPYSPVVVDVFLIVYQLGICCVYIVFTATNIKQVVDSHWKEYPLEWYMLALLLPLILINYVRNLKYLAPFSTLANAITFVGLGITMYYVFDDMPNPADRPFHAGINTFPLFVGTTLFALEAVGVVIALENNMKTPKNFRGYFGVLNRSMSIIVFFYVFVGFFGYVKYGENSKGSITLNLPDTEWLAQSVKLMFSVAIFITYALQCYVPLEILWENYVKGTIEKSNHKLFWEYVMRTVIVCATFVLAVAVPRLELFISLFGALCLATLGIVFPALIEICILWPNMGRYNWILIKDILLFVFGAAGLVIGTYTSLRDIIYSFL